MFLDKFKMKCKNFGKENQLLLFDILDYIVEQGNMNTWTSVSNKKFLSFILDILKNQSDAEIQTKLLQLIQNWGIDFEKKQDVIPNFYKIYNKFRINGVVFPPREESNYYKYILNSNPNKANYDDRKNDEYEDDKNYDDNDNNDMNSKNNFEYMETLQNKLKVQNFEHKYRRLVAFLLKMHDNIKAANICIDKRKTNMLKEPIETIKKGNKTLIDTISSGRLKDEKLMELTLGTTEDINQTLSREEDYKTGNRPKKFTSYFILNEIIPTKSNMKTRAKSEKKKVSLNPKNNYNYNKFEQNNNNNNNNFNNDKNNNNNNQINNVDDIFDLFSANKTSNANGPSNFPDDIYNNNNNNNNNQNNNNTFYINTNTSKNFMNNNNFNYNNYNKNNFNNNNGSNNNNKNNIDLLQESINLNNQQNNNQNNFQNNGQNKRNNNQNEFDMFGPSPEINSNQLVQYIGPFDQNNNNNNNSNNNNNNPYPSFNGSIQNNNNFGNNGNNMMDNNFGNNMNGNNGKQMTQEEIEREQRLKELDDLF